MVTRIILQTNTHSVADNRRTSQYRPGTLSQIETAFEAHDSPRLEESGRRFADVADAMLASLNQPATIKQAAGIAY